MGGFANGGGWTRRGALLAAAAAAAAGTVRADPLGLPIGVQLWAVKTELDGDFEGTLRRVAAIGYGRVEAAGSHGRTAAQFRAGVVAAGLNCDSAHVPMADLLKDPAGQIGWVRDVGCRWLVCSSPAATAPLHPAHPGEDWMDQMRRAMTLDDFRRDADRLNAFAHQAQRAGLKLAYHSHAFEFARYDGVVGFDELQRRTDPALVHTELDIAWVVAGGADPVEVMRRYGRRIALLHIKDLQHGPRPGDDYRTTAVGSGVIDWAPVFAEAARIGVSGYYVEQEEPFPGPVLGELAQSWRFLHTRFPGDRT